MRPSRARGVLIAAVGLWAAAVPSFGIAREARPAASMVIAQASGEAPEQLPWLTETPADTPAPPPKKPTEKKPAATVKKPAAAPAAATAKPTDVKPAEQKPAAAKAAAPAKPAEVKAPAAKPAEAKAPATAKPKEVKAPSAPVTPAPAAAEDKTVPPTEAVPAADVTVAPNAEPHPAAAVEPAKIAPPASPPAIPEPSEPDLIREEPVGPQTVTPTGKVTGKVIAPAPAVVAPAASPAEASAHPEKTTETPAVETAVEKPRTEPAEPAPPPVATAPPAEAKPRFATVEDIQPADKSSLTFQLGRSNGNFELKALRVRPGRIEAEVYASSGADQGLFYTGYARVCTQAFIFCSDWADRDFRYRLKWNDRDFVVTSVEGPSNDRGNIATRISGGNVYTLVMDASNQPLPSEGSTVSLWEGYDYLENGVHFQDITLPPPEEKKAEYAVFKTELPGALTRTTKLEPLVACADRIREYDDLRQATGQRAFELVSAADNIAGYKWFIQKLGDHPRVHDAVVRINAMSFAEAERIDTIEALNDFIISNPFAAEVKKASDRAYELEKAKHAPGWFASWFSSNDKIARTLLIQLKQIEQKGRNQDDRSLKLGYSLVVERMSRLLQEQFPTEDATLRFLESAEFKDFMTSLKSSIDEVRRATEAVAQNTSDMRRIAGEQAQMLDHHFKDAAQDRKMEAYLTEQHRDWEKQMEAERKK